MQTLSFSQRLIETCSDLQPVEKEVEQVDLFTSHLSATEIAEEQNDDDNNNDNKKYNITEEEESFSRSVDKHLLREEEEEQEEEESESEEQQRPEEEDKVTVLPNRSQMHLRKEHEVYLTPRRLKSSELRVSSSWNNEHETEYHKGKRLLFEESVEESKTVSREANTNEKSENNLSPSEELLELEELEKEASWMPSKHTTMSNVNTVHISKYDCDVINKHNNLASRTSYHSWRYGNFIRAYLQWSNAEVRKACYKARHVSAVGVVRANRNKDAILSTSITFEPNVTHTDHNVFDNSKISENRSNKIITTAATTAAACAYKTSRPFRRHSALAVEGDATFAEIIEYAHESYKHSQCIAEQIYKFCYTSEQCREQTNIHKCYDNNKSSNKKDDYYEQYMEKLELELNKTKPNARCIVIHYGINAPLKSNESSTESSYKNRLLQESKESVYLTRYVQVSSEKFKRATLIAILATTRLEKNTIIVVDVNSYYRCLNEGKWYEHVYRNSWHNNNNKWNSCVNNENDLCCANSLCAEQDYVNSETNRERNLLLGNVESGIKVFTDWPERLPFYHGVGKLYGSMQVANAINSITTNNNNNNFDSSSNKFINKHKAVASFPFTLVNLVQTPELGPNEMGLIAAMFIPYATCFLYTGPVLSVKQAEYLFNNNNNNNNKSNSNNILHVTELEDKNVNVICELAMQRNALKEHTHVSNVTGNDNIHNVSNHEKNSADGNQESSNKSNDYCFLDETYALGLDKENICFGQGLGRYINHRYNLSRFGNCELCTIMLSLPSSVIKSKSQLGKKNIIVRKRPRRQQRRRCSCELENQRKAKKVANSATILNKERKAEPKESLHKDISLVSNSNNSSNEVEFTDDVACNAAGMLTIPFFITTSDIDAGNSLLAWSYGEDYDAKLERHVVANSQIVPLRDGILLNQRLKCSTNNVERSTSYVINKCQSNNAHCSIQRYGGDYRFALGVGDVVWRRRPRCASLWSVKHFEQQSYQDEQLEYIEQEQRHECNRNSNSKRDYKEQFCNEILRNRSENVEMHFAPEDKVCNIPILFAHPQYDLFQVMSVMESGMEYVLLRELLPEHWKHTKENSSTLYERNKNYTHNNNNNNNNNYSSSNVSVSVSVSAWDEFVKQHNLSFIAAQHMENNSVAELSDCGKVMNNYDVTESNNLINAKEWVFYRLVNANNCKLTEMLDKCVIATSDSVGLLLSGTDYHVIQSNRKNSSFTGLTTTPSFTIYLPHITQATSLVMSAVNDKRNILPALSPLWSGSIWPLLQKCSPPHTFNEMWSLYCSSSEEDESETSFDRDDSDYTNTTTTSSNDDDSNEGKEETKGC